MGPIVGNMGYLTDIMRLSMERTHGINSGLDLIVIFEYTQEN